MGPTGQSLKEHRDHFCPLRWFEQFNRTPTYKDGFSPLRIPRLRFVEPDDGTVEWHGFISPSNVLRAAHLIPAFAWEFEDAQPYQENSHAACFHKGKWPYHYANM